MSTSEMRENESEVDIKAHLINFNMKTGPKIGNNLAHNHDLVSQDNGTQIMNLFNLTVNKMSEEITPSDFLLQKRT